MGKTQNKSVLIGIAVALVAVVSLAVILLNNDTKAPEEPSTVLIIDEAGTFDVGTDYEEVIINVPDVTIQNGSVNKIFVADTVGDGDVTLLNVTSNELELEGGGPNSITIAGTSNIKAIRVERTDGGIRVVVTDSSSVETVTVYKGSQDVTLEGKFDNLAIDASNINISVKNATMGTLSVSGEGTSITVDEKSTITTANFLPTATKTTFTLNGSVEKLVVESKESAIEVNGKVTAVDIKKDAEKASITINEGAEVASLATSTEVSVNGTGTLKEVTADDESNLVGTIKPGKVTVLNEPAKEPEAPKPTTPTPTTKPAEPSKPKPAEPTKPAEPQKPVDPPKKDILVSKITITGGNKVVNGSTLQLTATVAPENATIKTVKWTLENTTGTATISESGLLSATGIGTVKVIATATDGSGVSQELVVTIEAPPVIKAVLYPTPSGSTLPSDNIKVQINGTEIKSYIMYFDGVELEKTDNGIVTVVSSLKDDLSKVEIIYNGKRYPTVLGKQ